MTTDTIDRDRRVVTVHRDVPVAAELLFDLVARPAMHPVFDGSGMVRGGIFGPERLTGVGQRFGMWMRQFGLPYAIWSRTVEFEEGRVIAWRHVVAYTWRYTFTPIDGGAGTRVTEEFDWGTAHTPAWLSEKVGYPELHLAGMAASLERLEGLALGHRLA